MKIKKNIAYWCKTEELAKDFLQKCKDTGIVWHDKINDKGVEISPDRNCWNLYGIKTCYIIDPEFIDGSVLSNLFCCSYDYSIANVFKIIKWRKNNNMGNNISNVVIKLGDKVTFDDGSILIIHENSSIVGEKISDLCGFDDGLVKIERPKYETIYEKPEILDKVEKKYLYNFLRPFKDKIRYIIKHQANWNFEYLSILTTEPNNIILPAFKYNTMYVGMKPEELYTLQELKIFKD